MTNEDIRTEQLNEVELNTVSGGVVEGEDGRTCTDLPLTIYVPRPWFPKPITFF